MKTETNMMVTMIAIGLFAETSSKMKESGKDVFTKDEVIELMSSSVASFSEKLIDKETASEQK